MDEPELSDSARQELLRSTLRANFPATRWSLVLRLREGDENARAEALEQLCAAYRLPILTFLRQAPDFQVSSAEAEDLTQEFLSDFALKEKFAQASPDKGVKLRTFLIRCLTNFAIDRWRRQQAEIRGGNLDHVPIESVAHLEKEPSFEEAVLAFDRSWGRELFRQAVSTVKAKYLDRGQADWFAEFHAIACDPATSREEAAKRCGMEVKAFNAAYQRFRKKLQKATSDQLLETVADWQDFDEELAYLKRILGEIGLPDGPAKGAP